MMKDKLRTLSVLIVFVVLFSIVPGCSQGGANTAAEVGEKLELAIKYLSESNFEQAILAYQDVIKIDPKQVVAYKGISLAYALQDKMDEAEQALQDGLKAMPGSQEITLALAGLLVDLERNEEAEKLYRELVEKDDTYLPALKAYTSYLQTHGHKAEAIQLLETEIKKVDDYTLNTLLAFLYIQNGDSEKALTMLKQSLLKEPGQVEAYNLLVDLYADDLQKMIAFADEYTEENAATGSLIKLAALCQMKDYEAMLSYYDGLSKDIKNSPKALCLAAKANLELGETKKASVFMDLIQADNINDALLLAEIAQYYLDAGDTEKARKIAMQGIAVDDTVIENYLVMYKSCANEDQNLAQGWAYKYVLAGYLSYENTLSQLEDCILELASPNQSEDELTSKEIVQAIVRDQSNVEKWLESHDNLPHQLISMAYLDTDTNIAYRGYTDRATNWNPIIVRHHSPVFYSKDNIPANIIDNVNQNASEGWRNTWQGIISNDMGGTKYFLAPSGTPTGKVNWAYAVTIEGDIPFEEHLQRAGYPINNIMFMDM